MSSTNSKKEESTFITIKLLVRRLTTRPKSSSNWSQTSFSILQEVQLSEENNRWIWRYNKEVNFNLASAYHIQFHLMSPSNTQVGREISTLPLISDSWPPSKVKVFSQKLLHDRLPFGDNLFKYKVLVDPEATFCIMCGDLLK